MGADAHLHPQTLLSREFTVFEVFEVSTSCRGNLEMHSFHAVRAGDVVRTGLGYTAIVIYIENGIALLRAREPTQHITYMSEVGDEYWHPVRYLRRIARILR